MIIRKNYTLKLFKEKELLKQDEVLDDDFNISDYVSERHHVPSRDGKEIPISLVYKKKG